MPQVRTMERLAALILMAGLIALSPYRAAEAAGIARCAAYATDAVKAANEVRERACGFDLSHPQWSTDSSAHRRWCLESSDESVDHESAQRDTQLGNCRRCDDYAGRAVKSAQTVRDLNCGYDFEHPQWSLDPAVHREWCLASREDSMSNEDGARAHQEKRCSICRDYANSAMAALAEGRKRQCRLTGPLWTDGAEAHFGFCMGLKGTFVVLVAYEITLSELQQKMRRENEARTRALEQCTKAASTPQGLSRGAVGAVPRSAVPRKKERAATKPATAARRPQGSSAMDRLSPSQPMPAGDGGGPAARAPSGSGGAGGSAAGSGGTGGGSGGAVLFRGGSNMVAPPPTGGLR